MNKKCNKEKNYIILNLNYHIKSVSTSPALSNLIYVEYFYNYRLKKNPTTLQHIDLLTEVSLNRPCVVNVTFLTIRNSHLLCINVCFKK